MITAITLDALETLIIQAMRRHLDTKPNLWLPSGSKLMFDDVEACLRRFIDLLRSHDPFTVKLRPIFDLKATLFEMQILYAICEKRRDNDKAVSNVLHWWFPQANVPEALELLGQIATLLNQASVDLHTSKQLQEKMLVASVRRPKRYQSSVYVNPDQHPVFNDLDAKTFH